MCVGEHTPFGVREMREVVRKLSLCEKFDSETGVYHSWESCCIYNKNGKIISGKFCCFVSLLFNVNLI